MYRLNKGDERAIVKDLEQKEHVWAILVALGTRIKKNFQKLRKKLFLTILLTVYCTQPLVRRYNT